MPVLSYTGTGTGHADAYGIAEALHEFLARVIAQAGHGHLWLGEQALRAAASTAFHVSEAAQREGDERIRCLRIARGSALQVGAAVNLLYQRDSNLADRRVEAQKMVHHLAGLLNKMIGSAKARREPETHAAHVELHAT